jgi:flavin reductase (DIM6/NTAB) family NADH-FMN oxidoreductase RutF
MCLPGSFRQPWRAAESYRDGTTTSREVRSPVIEQCVVHYECRILHRNDLVPEALAQAVREQFYAQGDFHRFYQGEIVAAYADDDAERRLRKAGTLTSLP